MTPSEGAWGSCPECKGAITETMAFCKECGFPLKPVQKPAAAPPAPAPPVRPTTRSFGRKGRPRRGEGG